MQLSSEALARLAKLHLRTKAVVDGLITGLHRSPSRGQSVEFAEHKEYSPGDEIRHIDWRAYGKLDRYYVKRYEQETNLDAYLVVDGSASMGFGGGFGGGFGEAASGGSGAGLEGDETKYGAAALLATSFATLLSRQQDRVGLALWRAGALQTLPPHSSPAHLNQLATLLVQSLPAGSTDLGALANGLSEKLRRRSLVLVLSDLFDGDHQGLSRLTALRAQGHDVAILQILDPAELEFPYEEPTLFLSMEDERRLEINPRELRRGYLIEFERFLAATAKHCRERDCDYDLVRTDAPPEKVLAAFLGRRLRRRGLDAV